MPSLRGFDAWLASEPEGSVEPHAPWEVVFLSREGDHAQEWLARCGRCHRPMSQPPRGQVASGVCSCGGLIENVPGSWGIERVGDLDGESACVVGEYAAAVESARRCNAVYAYVPERDLRPDGTCSRCGDMHGGWPIR